MAGNPLVAEAVDTVARHILAQLVEFPDLTIEWADYPDIGEGDWDLIEQRMTQLTPPPKDDVYLAAYEFLKQRAAAVEA